MLSLLKPQRPGPIGVDIGTRSVKLVQCTADGERLIDLARWDFPASGSQRPAAPGPEALAEAVKRVMEGKAFRGRDAVVCLTERELFLQSLRLPKGEPGDLARLVQQEAVGRLPYPIGEAEVRFIEAADVKQGATTMREVILLACRRADLERLLEGVEKAGLWPVGVDIEPLALARCGLAQFRRDNDHSVRTLHVHLGHSGASVVIAHGGEALFIKNLEIGGRQFDLAVSRSLEMELSEAAALRRSNGDRRADDQDPEVSAAVADATRPIVEQLAGELAMCVRYHSVTFRGQPLARMVLGGGEASPALLEELGKRLELKCELSDPLRRFAEAPRTPHPAQWDIAVGLALRNAPLTAEPEKAGAESASAPAKRSLAGIFGRRTKLKK